uniref:Uncharacterized protein n=1 Tax=uncultured Thiotrichaceae bacterium TaxID=298394 RepID=A0A6S6UIL3_9GAMM|nr:MAG: Unknown protein [uncultured Thiotrichaceae bacterium]
MNAFFVHGERIAAERLFDGYFLQHDNSLSYGA